MVVEEEKKIKRYKPNIDEGLSQKQVEERIAQKLVNFDTSVPTKSIKRILYDNIFTLFNLLNIILGVAVISVKSYKNVLFLGIAFLNTVISTFQEIRSKKVIDSLSIMASNKTRVIRNSKEEEIPINELVLDDIVKFNTGNQIPTDCIILNGNIEVNESFITGEPDGIQKDEGDTILSGSFVVSGRCIARVKNIGEDNYTAQISSGAKYVKKLNSEIMSSLKKVIQILTFILIPVGIITFLVQFNLPGMEYKTAIIKTVAAIIGMIPEGLVLLTSTVLAVSVIRLAKSNVLVQELYCIETLARVDTLCLDKTGTLTEGHMEVFDYIPKGISKSEMSNILSNIAKFSVDENATIDAIKDSFFEISKEYIPNKVVSFSSKTKWSGVNFKNKGTYVIGAPEFILKEKVKDYINEIEDYSKDYRVIALAYSEDEFCKNELPSNINLIGYILIVDKIRDEASKTLKYFKKQGVEIKIISGDSPVTVSKIAKRLGVKEYKNFIDLSTIKDEEIYKVADQYTIFGRVSPTQKRQLIKALKESGKTVAMTGDGVNDVLALKEADCSIAMANGSDAAKNVSQLVLLDSNFDSMPKIVEEGRRTINNIERSASLFFVKTIYSCLLAIMFIFMHNAYPFVPIQLSLISIVTIGIPSFILALEPNNERISGDFIKNVIFRAIPGGLTVVINIIIITIFRKNGLISMSNYSTLCVIGTGISGILLLYTLAKKRKSENTKLPFSVFRMILAISLTIVFVFGLTVLSWWFNIAPLKPIAKEIISLVCFSAVEFYLLSVGMKKILKIKE